MSSRWSERHHRPAPRRLRRRRWRTFGLLHPIGLLIPRHIAAAFAPSRRSADKGDLDDRADDPQRPFRVYDQLAELTLRWERCTLARREWDHRAHLAVATWHLALYDESRATARVIAGIRRYNQSQGIQTTRSSGYHETLTLFWLHTARCFLARLDPGLPLLAKVNAFVHEFGDKQGLFLDYYSRERIMSWRARQRWIEPDLKPLDR